MVDVRNLFAKFRKRRGGIEIQCVVITKSTDSKINEVIKDKKNLCKTVRIRQEL